MIAQLERLGATKRRLQAVLIGGARMFAIGAAWNRLAERSGGRAALSGTGSAIHAEETGGNRGRTARVVLGTDVSSQLAGGERTSLMSLRAAAVPPSPARGPRAPRRSPEQFSGAAMNDILNPDQIAALVRGGQVRQLPRRSGQAPRRTQRLRTVDFSRPTKFTSDHQRRI